MTWIHWREQADAVTEPLSPDLIWRRAREPALAESFGFGLEISKEMARALQGSIDDYRSESTVEFAALLEEGGMVVVSSVVTTGGDSETVGALAVAAFASLRALSKHIGEERFEGCFQHGRDRHFHLCEVFAGFLLFSVFGNHLAPGLVGLYTKKATNRIANELKRHGAGRGTT